jgi:hypothetical protein
LRPQCERRCGLLCSGPATETREAAITDDGDLVMDVTPLGSDPDRI